MASEAAGLHHSHFPQARLISPTTRWPIQLLIVRLHHFTDELVPRRAAKAVVAALQFEICVADSAV